MQRSPSTRRAWIEILKNPPEYKINTVALHPEGVDRNPAQTAAAPAFRVALHPEGVDRNNLIKVFISIFAEVALHPEGVDRNILICILRPLYMLSPSTRRAWIEIISVSAKRTRKMTSPSTRRAWIEMQRRNDSNLGRAVALHPEGVDRNV